eukprot:jgi/Botrbrau1/12830/Bobra.0045s0002.2
MALSCVPGRYCLPRTFFKPVERELTGVRLAPASCRRPATAPSCVHFTSPPSSNNGKVPDSFGRDEEDSLAPLSLISPPALPVSSPVRESGTADRADAAPVLAEIAREKFWGRVAVLALGAALLAERLTGQGVVHAMELSTGIPLWEIDPFLGFLVIGLLVAAFFPSKSEQGEIMRNARAAHQKARNFGKSMFDTVQNFIGRMACFGLASSIVAEVTTGQV